MSDKDTNFLAPILSALAGLGAIIAALSPLFTRTRITSLFIDSNSSGFLAVMAFVATILALWLFGSRTASLVFRPTVDLVVLAKRRVLSLFLFVISATMFYSVELVYDSGAITFGWGSFLQAIFYLLSFLFLAITIGMQFRDTYEQYRWKNDEENKTNNIRQLLISSGHVPVDLKIIAITSYIFDPQNDPPNWQSAVRVVFQTSDQRHEAILDQNIKNVLGTAPIKKPEK